MAEHRRRRPALGKDRLGHLYVTLAGTQSCHYMGSMAASKPEWRKDLEKEGLYDPVVVGLEARREATLAKFWSAIGAIVSTAGLLVSILGMLLCSR